MKGIITAGGAGTRMYPTTKSISKHLLPVYDKPMIYYPISVLMLAGIKEILIISTPRSIPLYKDLLGDGSQLGISFSYVLQKEPRGVAEAFLLGENFIGEDKTALMLGDNIIYGQGFSGILKNAASLEQGAVIFGYEVKDPGAFGTVKINEKGKAAALKEKPSHPETNLAVPGLYFYDNEVVKKAKNLTPSPRGELEITDLNRKYLKQGQLKVKQLGRGTAWFDAGTYDGLLKAGNFVEAIQKRQGLYIACLEEIAYKLGYINEKQLQQLAQNYPNSKYGNYISSLS